MTNYNERLNKIIDRVYLFGMNGGLGYEKFDNELSPAKAKQAITSLIKELVAEAKPSEKTDTRGATQNPNNAFYHTKKAQGYNEAIDQFEQNLLKELEEV